jgi:DNA polymerase V
MCSRSFGEKLTQYTDLKEAVCEFAARAAEKLRRDNQLALMVNVFVRTSPFDKSGPDYSNAATGTLTQPSSDTMKILDLVVRLFDLIWKDGYRYAKGGVMLGDFCSPDDVQFNLFDNQPENQRSDTLMKAVDSINQKAHGKIWFGGQRPQKDWFMRQANVSPAYTTRWSSIPEVK